MLRRTLTLLCLSLLGFGCGDEEADAPTEPETLELEVAHYRVPCTGEGRQLCLLTREVAPSSSQPDEWTLEYTGVQGFEPEWGVAYRLRVVREVVENPPADGSGERLYLDTIVSERPTRESFELTLEPGDLAPHGDADYLLLGDRRLNCATHEVCQSLRIRQEMGMAVTVMARPGESTDAPLSAFRIM